MWAGRQVEELPTPAFTVDLDVVKRNAQRMSERCGALGVSLRPHMKTHKTLEGGELMTGGTRWRIVVSTLAEARFFADGGFDDILYAYPLPFDKVDECAALAERLESFHVLVDSPQALALLKRRSLSHGRHWKVWLKIDCENGRAGLRHVDPAALELAKAIAEGATELAGIYAHCGNSYHCHGVSEIQSVARATTLSALAFQDKMKNQHKLSSTGVRPSQKGKGLFLTWERCTYDCKACHEIAKSPQRGMQVALTSQHQVLVIQQDFTARSHDWQKV